MAFKKGTAQDICDLVNQLEDFITQNGWVSQKDNQISPYTRTYDFNGTGEQVILPRFFKGSGLAGHNEIYISMAVHYNTQQGYYTLGMYANRSYDKTKAWDKQYKAQNYAVFTSMWEQPMPYWFFATGRRFIFVAKVANRYASMYGGMFLPSGTDLEYPYPVMAGGNHISYNQNYGQSNIGSSRSFWSPATNRDSGSSYSSLFAYRPDYSHMWFAGAYASSRGFHSWSTANYGHTHPYVKDFWVGRSADDNQHLILPIDLWEQSPNQQVLGTIDGCCFITGHLNAPESEVTVEGKTYLCFPALIQSDFNDYVAIEKA